MLYFWLEIALRSVLVFGSCFMLILFFLMKVSESNSNFLEYFLEHSIVYVSVCLVPVLVVVIMTIRKAMKWRIIGFQFYEDKIELMVRKNKRNSIRVISLSKPNLKVFSCKENAFLGIGGVRFFVFENTENKEQYWFNFDHYIWEKQRKEKLFFKKYIRKEWGVEIVEKPKELEPKDVIPRY